MHKARLTALHAICVQIFRRFAKKRQMTREVVCRFVVWLCVLLVFRLFCCLYMVEDTGEQFFRHQL